MQTNYLQEVSKSSISKTVVDNKGHDEDEAKSHTYLSAVV